MKEFFGIPPSAEFFLQLAGSIVTEVKSGNNTVQYTYDNKRRVKSVSLNGVDDYVAGRAFAKAQESNAIPVSLFLVFMQKIIDIKE